MADDILIGEADNEAVFRSVVFVLGLGDEALASVVVGFTCSTTLVLGLEATVLTLGKGFEEEISRRMTLTYSRRYS